ncbi:virB8 family protein [Caballeronia sordidicola]|nr:type IV secretion system protein [Caballeronia sordidicola]
MGARQSSAVVAVVILSAFVDRAQGSMTMFSKRKHSPGSELVMSSDAVTAPDAGEAATSDKNGSAIATGRWYLQQALKFETSKQEQQAKQTKLAWRVAIGAGAIAVVSVIGSAALVQLKRPNPPAVLRMNDTTGVVDVLNVSPNNREIFTEKNDRADLRRYVEMRESYDWETIQDMFDAVKLMSADKERDQFISMYALANAPQKVLKDQFRVIARVGAITFVGSTAQVFFSRKLISLSGSMPPKTEYWVATIAYRHDHLPEKASELELDPTGFRVISYVVDRDWTRASDAPAPVPLTPTGLQPVSPATAGAAATNGQRGTAQ